MINKLTIGQKKNDIIEIGYNQKKIITIGDIHGRDDWKKSIKDFDKNTIYVFVGDYVDSFTKTNMEILENLKEIIQFKKEYVRNVILLIGNHELQYIFNEQKLHNCTGFRPEMYFDLNKLLTDNKDLFSLSFEVEGINEEGKLGKYLWTHAGIHRGWFAKFDKGLKKEDYRHKDFFDDSMSISEKLNIALLLYNKDLFDCSPQRGGFMKEGGPFWADFNEVYNKPLLGYHQIIGHTVRDNIKTYNCYQTDDTSTTFVDCCNKEVFELKLTLM